MTPTTENRGSLVEALDRLAGIESPQYPVVSLYLDTRADQQGRDHWDPFVRKALQARLRTYALRSPARESLERDVEKIRRYLSEELPPEANGLAVFACSALGLFQASPTEAPFEENRLSVSSRPQLYPLARLIDEHPRFAVLVADTRSARILVAGRGGRVLGTRRVEGRPSRWTDAGGWSQMRFQRHVDDIRRHNVREIVAALERVVREDRIGHVVIAGDEVALPMIRAELSREMQQRVADTLRLDVHTPDREVLEEAVAALRSRDEKTDAEKVQRALDDYRAGGLAVVGPEAVEAALSAGQVDELLISATLAPPANAVSGPGSPGEKRAPEHPRDEGGRLTAEIADELVRMARQTSANVTFIENSSVLRGCDGVAASLRYRLTGTGVEKNP